MEIRHPYLADVAMVGAANSSAYASGDTGVGRMHGAHRLPYEATPRTARPHMQGLHHGH